MRYKAQLDGAAARVKLMVRVAVRVVGVASAAVGLFLVAVDCVSLPSRASSADAPEEKEADELEAVSPTSPPDIPT